MRRSASHPLSSPRPRRRACCAVEATRAEEESRARTKARLVGEAARLRVEHSHAGACPRRPRLAQPPRLCIRPSRRTNRATTESRTAMAHLARCAHWTRRHAVNRSSPWRPFHAWHASRTASRSPAARIAEERRSRAQRRNGESGTLDASGSRTTMTWIQCTTDAIGTGSGKISTVASALLTVEAF